MRFRKYILPLFALLAVSTPLIAHAAGSCTQTVVNTNDSGSGSLRAAITSANSAGGVDTICFSIGSGYQTINLSSQLPPITQPAILDGTSQPGYSGVPLIELNGSAVGGSGVPGVWITNGGSTVKGLIVNRFSGDGIIMTDVGGNTITGNYVGTNSAGTAGLGNGTSGIGMLRSSNNVIGGSTPQTRNVVSGNGGNGIAITDTTSTGNTVTGNYVGTNASGDSGIANGGDGILLNAARNNTIGGTAGATPGAACSGECNLLSGNTYNGLGMINASSNTVIGNYIGVKSSGMDSLANGDIGVELQESSNNTVGGTIPAGRNVISGNIGAGMLITGSGATGNTVTGNFIGTNANGTVGIANHKMGISIGNSPGIANGYARSNTIGGISGTTPGGACTGACNLISGNQQNGVILSGGSGSGNSLLGNYIGTNVSGMGAISNGLDGVGILNSPNNTIGDGSTAGANLISANSATGIIIASGGSTGNRITGNAIGLNSAGGGLGNGTVGVAVAAGTDTAIMQNKVYANTGIGIDLGLDGVTQNHPNGSGSGANEQTNFPAVYAAHSAAGVTKIAGLLNNTPNSSFRLEFFSSDGCNAGKPLNYGEGQNYLGSTDVTTDKFGNISFAFAPASVVPGGKYITATSTKMRGNIPAETSEFSKCLLVNTAKPAVSNGATWYLKDDLTPGSADTSFGYGFPATLLMCAWDPAKPGVRLPVVVAGTTWYLRASYTTGTADLTFQYGFSGTTPVCGDWDGDGIETPGIVSANRTWYLRNSNSPGSADATFQYGGANNTPVVGDWDGDGSDSIGLVDYSGNWSLRNTNSSGPADISFQYGAAGGRPIVGDWDGDTIDSIGMIDANNTWSLRNINNSGPANYNFQYGFTGASPLVW